MIGDLIKLAEDLDSKGLFKEADILDQIIIKLADDEGYNITMDHFEEVFNELFDLAKEGMKLSERSDDKAVEEEDGVNADIDRVVYGRLPKLLRFVKKEDEGGKKKLNFTLGGTNVFKVDYPDMIEVLDKLRDINLERAAYVESLYSKPRRLGAPRPLTTNRIIKELRLVSIK